MENDEIKAVLISIHALRGEGDSEGPVRGPLLFI